MEILKQLLPSIKPENVKLCLTPGPDKNPQQNKGKFIVKIIESYRPKAESPKKSPRAASATASASASPHSPKKSPRSASVRANSQKGSSTARSRYGLKGGSRKSKNTRRRKYRK